MATITVTRTDTWAAFACIAALICAVGFGQAFRGGMGIAAWVLFLDWLFAMCALVYLRAQAASADGEVHP